MNFSSLSNLLNIHEDGGVFFLKKSILPGKRKTKERVLSKWIPVSDSAVSLIIHRRVAYSFGASSEIHPNENVLDIPWPLISSE